MKVFVIIVVILAVLGIGGYLWMQNQQPTVENDISNEQNKVPNNETSELPEVETSTSTEDVEDDEMVIGTSVEGNDITAYSYGDGETRLLFVGGIHGGYSWNTSLVAYELMDYLEENPDAVPENVRVTVIPVMNPDGLEEVVGETGRFSKSDVPAAKSDTVAGRFNANEVDLNRNFECDWQASANWQNKTVSGGSSAFSEPESIAIREYVEKYTPNAVVVWYSAAGGVYASSCHNGVSDITSTLTKTYADASGYPASEDFDFYEITGDMVNWFAKENIPAISVLLTTHTDIEWNKNKAGIEALFNYFAE